MSASKRIGYLVSHYPAVNHTYVLREVRELRRLGWDIHVVSVRPDLRPVSRLTVEEQEERSRTWCVTAQGFGRAMGAHLVSLARKTLCYLRGLLLALRLAGANPRKVARYFFYFTEALLVGQWMLQRGLEHIHIHYASTVGMLLAKVFPVTISITIHGSAEFEEPAASHLREKIKVATFVCAISNYGRSQLMKASPPDQWSKFEVVRLGIDPEVFTPNPKQAVERPTFGIISVAQLHPAKGHRILIDAVDRLVKEGRRVRLRVVGEGPDRLALERYIEERDLSAAVRLEGALNQDQLIALYRESDAFALASFAEGIPVVLMEAMAMGIPCVATWITGIPELIQDGVDGLLIAPSDAEQLAAAIARLMDDPDLRKRIAMSGRCKVLQEYCLADNTAQLGKVFEQRVGTLF